MLIEVLNRTTIRDDAAIPAKNKRLKVNHLNNANLKSPRLSAASSPSLPTQSRPAATTSLSSSLHTNATTLKAQRFALLHLLAIRELPESRLLRRTGIPPDTLSKLLNSVAEQRSSTSPSEPSDPVWSLAARRYKELDIWAFKYTPSDRELARENAIHALDKLRLNPQDKAWQLLLQLSERGKGKTLSRLSLFPSDHRKILGGLDGASKSQPNSPLHSSNEPEDPVAGMTPTQSKRDTGQPKQNAILKSIEKKATGKIVKSTAKAEPKRQPKSKEASPHPDDRKVAASQRKAGASKALDAVKSPNSTSNSSARQANKAPRNSVEGEKAPSIIRKSIDEKDEPGKERQEPTKASNTNSTQIQTKNKGMDTKATASTTSKVNDTKSAQPLAKDKRREPDKAAAALKQPKEDKPPQPRFQRKADITKSGTTSTDTKDGKASQSRQNDRMKQAEHSASTPAKVHEEKSAAHSSSTNKKPMNAASTAEKEKQAAQKAAAAKPKDSKSSQVEVKPAIPKKRSAEEADPSNTTRATPVKRRAPSPTVASKSSASSTSPERRLSASSSATAAKTSVSSLSPNLKPISKPKGSANKAQSVSSTSTIKPTAQSSSSTAKPFASLTPATKPAASSPSTATKTSTPIKRSTETPTKVPIKSETSEAKGFKRSAEPTNDAATGENKPAKRIKREEPTTEAAASDNQPTKRIKREESTTEAAVSDDKPPKPIKREEPTTTVAPSRQEILHAYSRYYKSFRAFCDFHEQALQSDNPQVLDTIQTQFTQLESRLSDLMKSFTAMYEHFKKETEDAHADILAMKDAKALKAKFEGVKEKGGEEELMKRMREWQGKYAELFKDFGQVEPARVEKLFEELEGIKKAQMGVLKVGAVKAGRM